MAGPDLRCQHGGDRGAGGGGELGGAASEVELSVRVGAAQEQHFGGLDWSDDAADDGFGGEPGAELLPSAHAGPVGLVDALGDDAFDAEGGVAEQPGAGDLRVGGGRG